MIMGLEAKMVVLIWLVGFCLKIVSEDGSVVDYGPLGSFDVTVFGGVGDGVTDDTKAFKSMWKVACAQTGDVEILIPNATYLIGPIKFSGPCQNTTSITFRLEGYLKASTDLERYDDDWVEFGWINRLTVTGGGTIDGQGSSSWRYNTCSMNRNCKILPISLKFIKCSNTVLTNISSLNSKFFHIALLDCKNFNGSNISISAPKNSPNTDGIHMERCTNVRISDSQIGTGDDCISVGHGISQVSITQIICGPGHGISVGSLGRYSYEKDVRGLTVTNCILTGTQNGLRIKTWSDSPSTIKATNMTFQNIIMNNVANPIIIDQTYCPYKFCTNFFPSRVKISNIFFKNIRGTSSTPVAVTLKCSKGMPCQNINLEDVHLDVAGGKEPLSDCRNARVRYRGTQLPPPCVL